MSSRTIGGWVSSALAAAMIAGCSSDSTGPAADTQDAGAEANAGPAWLSNARVVVSGHGLEDNHDCRTSICRHNENTDLVSFKGAPYLVHRTAWSQILGPNSALHVYRSADGGQTFEETARIEAPLDRDLRDPHFFVVGDELRIKALTRLPVNSVRDSEVDTIAVLTKSTDGKSWTPLEPITPATWSLWRIKQQAGVWYSAAYEDGDKSVVLYSSADGTTWTRGALVYGVSEDTPLETELTFLPSGKLLALVRMDGNQQELLGDRGRLRTKICWADPPYDKFDCPDEFSGQRLDGPLSFLWQGRLFVIARKHLPEYGRKRTALFEIDGELEGGALAIKEWGELPSAGDTSYAGQVALDDHQVLVSWYSGDLGRDETWALGMGSLTDIWLGEIDLSLLLP